MPREVKSERVIKILLYLQETKGRTISVGDVMKRLGVGEDERINVQRDLRLLATMTESGVEAVGSGRELGYRISRAAQRAFTLDRPLERNDLFSFLLLSRLQQGMLRGGAERIRLFEELLQKSLKEAAPSRDGSNAYADLSARFSELVLFAGEEIVRGPDHGLVPTLFSALLERRKLEVEYESMGDEAPARRILEPWRLLVFRGEVYFVCPKGGKRTALYTYKLSRMTRARLLDETFTVDAKLLKAFTSKLAKGMGLYTDTRAKIERVSLSFPMALRLVLRERKPHGSHVVKLDKMNDRVLVHLDVPLNEDLLEWIRKWGDRVEVLRPKALKMHLLGYADYLRDTYGTGA